MNPAWALLRLASPQLPIGGYSYSQGLEMAVENARVSNADSARRWISDQLLLNLARFEAPLHLVQNVINHSVVLFHPGKMFLRRH